MLYVFDLDGTLIDNYEAVLQSYRDAGVEPPLDFFCTPSSEWPKPPTAEQKLKKERAYLLNLRLARVGPALPLWHSVSRDEKQIMTGASHAGAKASMNALGLSSAYASHGMVLAEKIHALRILKDFHEGGVYYIDGDPNICKYITERAGCQGITFV